MNTEPPIGWFCPDGTTFIEATPTPGDRVRGESLGGHEQAALAYLSERPTLLYELHQFREAESQRLGVEFQTWEDTDGHDIINRFMQQHGFERVSPEDAAVNELRPTQLEIVRQIYIAIEGLGGGIDLLSTIGSWGDTLSEQEVLSFLKDYNTRH